MEESNLMTLLALSIEEEKFYLEMYHKELSFFWGSISLILGATIAGGMKAESSFDYLILLVGPLLILAVGRTIKESLLSSYGRFLEIISMRAKIELRLELNKELSEPLEYWGTEPILHPRHLKARAEFNSSSEFVEINSKKGIYEKHLKLISLINLLVGIISGILIFMAIFN